jgi:hypothetical protein
LRTKDISISKIVNIIKHWWIAAIGLTVASLAVASLTAAHFSKEFSFTTSKDAVLFYPEPHTCVAASQTINHVLLVGSDGLRADTFENLNHNTVRELTNSGFYTRGYVQTDSDGRRIEAGTDENIPAIISGKALHDIYQTGNGLALEGYEALGKPIPKKIETLFEVANRHNFYTGLSTASQRPVPSVIQSSIRWATYGVITAAMTLGCETGLLSSSNPTLLENGICLHGSLSPTTYRWERQMLIAMRYREM